LFSKYNLYKEDKTFKIFSENIKKGKEYLKLMDIYWPNNGYLNNSPPAFGADSHSTIKPFCTSFDRNIRHFISILIDWNVYISYKTTLFSKYYSEVK
jgi:hypothetical protein